MRNIINISVPPSMARLVDKGVKDGQYATKSEFLRALIRLWAEGKLRAELDDSRTQMRAGKGTLLRSLKDLQ